MTRIQTFAKLAVATVTVWTVSVAALYQAITFA